MTSSPDNKLLNIKKIFSILVLYGSRRLTIELHSVYLSNFMLPNVTEKHLRSGIPFF